MSEDNADTDLFDMSVESRSFQKYINNVQDLYFANLS